MHGQGGVIVPFSLFFLSPLFLSFPSFPVPSRVARPAKKDRESRRKGRSLSFFSLSFILSLPLIGKREKSLLPPSSFLDVSGIEVIKRG